MNVARPVGVSARLEINVRGKEFRARSGQRHAVLSDVTVTLEPGEVGAIFGPSGCGKTTLLRIIAGLESGWEGSISLPKRAGEDAPRVGVVFQEPRLLPWRTVEENVRLAAPGVSDEVLDRLFSATGLSAHRGHHPSELSGGLARRVALVRAFAFDPDLMLLDEPFVSLDAALAASLRRELASLVARNRVTTLLVTHDLSEAIELADRIFILSPRPARSVATEVVRLARSERTPDNIEAVRREFLSRGVLNGSGSGEPQPLDLPPAD